MNYPGKEAIGSPQLSLESVPVMTTRLDEGLTRLLMDTVESSSLQRLTEQLNDQVDIGSLPLHDYATSPARHQATVQARRNFYQLLGWLDEAHVHRELAFSGQHGQRLTADKPS